jgi:ubiquinone/menaquinone biosynthesis C-methylase UbiE
VKRLWWSLVRFGFRLLYNELAFTYDIVSRIVSLGQWRCWQRAALKYLDVPSGAFILELAHGTGNMQLDLNQAGYKAVGLDLSPHMGRIARAKLARQRLPARLVRGRGQQLPFASGMFSAVISTFPTDFIAAPETLFEVFRVLKPGGQIVIVPGAVFTTTKPSATVLEWAYRVTGQRTYEGTLDRAVDYFGQYGFSTQVFESPCPHSVVTIIALRRSTDTPEIH